MCIRDRRQGNIVVLDHETRPLMPLYPTPTPISKGVIVTGTVHGNTVITATAHERAAGDTETYTDDIEALLAGARKLVPDLDCRRVVRAFAGGRAVIRGLNDFMIRRSPCRPGLIQAAGIQSPGVASAPAIAERVEELVREEGLALAPRAGWDPHRCAPTDFDTASLEQQQALIELDPEMCIRDSTIVLYIYCKGFLQQVVLGQGNYKQPQRAANSWK